MASIATQETGRKPDLDVRGGPIAPAMAAQVADLFRPLGAPAVAGSPLAESEAGRTYTWRVDGWIVQHGYESRWLWLSWISPDGHGYELERCGTKRFLTPVVGDTDADDWEYGWPGMAT